MSAPNVFRAASKPAVVDITSSQHASLPAAALLDIKSVWAKDIEPVLDSKYLIKGFLYAGLSHFLVGAPSCGKTALMVDMACHIASGVAFWRGHRVRRAPVAILALETPRSTEQRIVAWAQHYGIDRSEIEVLVIESQPDLSYSDDVDSLIEHLRSEGNAVGGFGLIVIDTYARSAPGKDENSVGDTSSVLAGFDRLKSELAGPAWMALHHTPKDNPRGMRGSGNLRGAADIAHTIADHTLIVDKGRDIPTGTEVPFKLLPVVLGKDADGDSVAAIVAVEADGGEKPRVAKIESPKKMPGAATVAFDALKAVISDHGEHLPHTSQIPPNKKGARFETWRLRFIRRYGSDTKPNSLNTAFRRAKDELFSRQLIGIDGEFVWIW